MCFSAPVSFSTYAIALAISAVLMWRRRQNDLWNGGFIATFAMIQLIEGLIWLAKGQNDTCANHCMTKLIVIALVLQPVAQSAGAWFTNFFVYKGVPIWRKSIVSIQLTILFAFALFVIVQTLGTSTDHFSTIVGPNGHLVWTRNDSGTIFGSRPTWWPTTLYLFGLLVPLLLMRPISDGLILLSIGLATLLFSKLFFKEEVSSIWCFSAIIYAVAALCLSYTKQCGLIC